MTSPPGPRRPLKTAEIDCTPAGYPAWMATVRTNPPVFVSDAIFSGNRQQIRGAFPRVFLSWNFVDDDGVALPQPGEDGAFDAVPADLVGYLLGQYLQAFVDGLQESQGQPLLHGPPVEVLQEFLREVMQKLQLGFWLNQEGEN